MLPEKLLLALDTAISATRLLSWSGQLISLRGQERQALGGLGESQTSPQPAIEQLKIQRNPRKKSMSGWQFFTRLTQSASLTWTKREGVRQLELSPCPTGTTFAGAKEQFSGLSLPCALR